METRRRNEKRTLERTMEMSATSASLAERMQATKRRIHSLIVMRGLDVGHVIRLDRPHAVVGRDDSCDVVLSDEGVSRRHARFTVVGDQVVIEDLGSTNGVFLNGVPVSSSTLREGDKILLGRFTILKYQQQDELELEYQQKIHESASRDGLTGALNRRALEARLGAEWSYALRHGTDITAIMLDVDHFKRINDTYGHSTGDEVLRAIAETVRSTIRAEDLFGRYGGEEFLLIARDIGHTGGTGLAERLRALIAGLRFSVDGQPISVTVSLGVASRCEAGAADPASLVRVADERLYRAKQTGRNRVVGE